MKSNCPSTRCVYLIRHCESTDNTKKFERVLDPMLSIKGLQQAIELAKITKKLKIERLISSPLRRAIQTAHIGFNGFKGPWALDPRFREIYHFELQRGAVPLRQFVDSALSCELPHIDRTCIEHLGVFCLFCFCFLFLLYCLLPFPTQISTFSRMDLMI